MIVHHRHLAELGYCNRGARLFCRLNGIDWSGFIDNGISAEQLRATGDAQAIALVDHVTRSADGQG